MNKQRKKRKGFSMMEVVISLAMFVIIIVATAQIFTLSFSGYRYTKNLQKDTENAQLIMGILSKELRTSTIVSPSNPQDGISTLKFYDHSQGACLSYRISLGHIQVARENLSSVAACAGASLTNYQTVSTGTVDGSFDVVPSDASPRTVGRVTMGLRIRSDLSGHEAMIQNTVSLRDYGVDGSDI
jgi:prepilin-type N-terminal cleavage/methylation domain-containing protein